MGDIPVRIDVDTSELEEKVRAMDKLVGTFPSICARMMNAINKQLKKEIQRESRRRGYNKQHNFYRGIFARAGFKGKIKDYRHLYDMAGIGRPRGTRGKYSYYANTIESGAYINSDKPFRVFIDGGWKTLKTVHIPARPFVRNLVKTWYGSKGDALMEQEAQKIIDKYNLN